LRGARNERRGQQSTRPRRRRTFCPRSTSTVCRICCSSCAGSRTPTATCCGSRAPAPDSHAELTRTAALRSAGGPGLDPGQECHQGAAVERDLVVVLAVENFEDHNVLGHDVELVACGGTSFPHVDSLTGQPCIGTRT